MPDVMECAGCGAISAPEIAAGWLVEQESRWCFCPDCAERIRREMDFDRRYKPVPKLIPGQDF